MVAKRTEYRNQFRSNVARKHHAAYLENLTFRHERRDREFLHTPICWNDDVEEEDSSESTEDVEVVSCNLINRKIDPVTDHNQYQSLAEIIQNSKEKAVEHHKQKLIEKNDALKCLSIEELSIEEKNENNNRKKMSSTEEENLLDHDKDIGDKKMSIYDIVESENRALNEKIAKKYVLNPPDEKSTVTEDSSNLRKKSSTKNKKREERQAGCKMSKEKAQKSNGCSDPSKTATKISTKVRRPDRRPMSQASSNADRPPFISYGSGDVEENLAVHRTHNVRAPSDVYGAALKAKLRREQERKKYREQRELMHLSKQELLDKLSSPCEEIDWRSEYQKQFHAYEAKEYERAASARAIIPRVTPIRAVHRGGCVVVVVD